MHATTPAIATYEMRHPLLRGQEAVWHPHASQLKIRRQHKGDFLFRHGDPATHFWLVLSGWVKLVRQTPDGKESIIDLCTTEDVLGEASLFQYANYPYTAEVVGDDAELMTIPAGLMQQLVQENSRLSQQIMTLLNERTVQAQLQREHMSTLTAAQRLGCFLLRLCRGKPGQERTLEIPVEKHVLASYLGMKPETLSRSLQQLKPAGVEGAPGGVKVQQVECLRRYVCDSCSATGECENEPSD